MLRWPMLLEAFCNWVSEFFVLNSFLLCFFSLLCSNTFVSSTFCLGDLTKTMVVPIVGEVPIPAGLDLARVGLGALPKAPLPTGAGPSTRGPTGGGG